MVHYNKVKVKLTNNQTKKMTLQQNKKEWNSLKNN